MPVQWEQPAEAMLDRRDRFTRAAIAKEIDDYSTEELLGTSIEFDPTNAGYVKPVADNRYAVVFYLLDGDPVVRAVVPTARFKPGPDLKGRVEEIVSAVSNNLIKLR